MDLNKPKPGDALNARVPRNRTFLLEALAQNQRSRRRADAVANFFSELIADFLVAVVAAWPLMLGLDTLDVNAPYVGCFWIVLGLRWALNVSSHNDDR